MTDLTKRLRILSSILRPMPGVALCDAEAPERAADEIERLRAELDAWRERFPVAGFDGKSVVLSG